MWVVLLQYARRSRPSSSSSSTSLLVLLLAVILLPWLGVGGSVDAMSPSRIAELRRDTVDMFYHGFDNYMKIAFPEDEV